MPIHTALQVPPESLLPVSQLPSLLPFHIAYSGPAPVSTYFLPRPAPVDPHAPATDEPLLLSTFRGRQVVGQALKVPAGYTGVILDLPPPPAAPSSSSARSENRGFDPASVFTTPDVEPDQVDNAADGRASTLRRSPRKRVSTAAAARPPPAKKARVVAAKRFQLDSDSESEGEAEATVGVKTVEAVEEEDGEAAMPSLLSASTTALATPSLSSVSAATPMGSTEDDEAATVAATIVVDDVAIAGDDVQEKLEVVETAVLPSKADAAPKERSPTPADEEDAPMQDGAPAEDEPYTADQLLPTSSTASTSSLRLLKPLSTFDKITLWTADDPVDPGRDEFYRCLGQGGWLEMSRIIHDEEDDDEA